jgi:uncharacterized protein
MEQPSEPSVEEILESIKKVIARENGVGGVSTGRRRPIAGTIEPAAHDEAEEVLELDEAAAVAPAAEEDMEFATADADPVSEPALTAEATSSAMRDNLAALAMLAQPGRPPQIVRSGETSLEELTRGLLRPMLAKWLDENLPQMVEELVKAEIARIAGKRG